MMIQDTEKALEARALATVYQLLAQAAYEQRRRKAARVGEPIAVDQRPATSDQLPATSYQVERPS